MAKEKNTYDDLKVVDCGNGNMLITMKKETWQTIVRILEYVSDLNKQKRKEAEL